MDNLKRNQKQNRRPQGTPNPKNPKPKFNMYWIYGLIILIIIGMQFINFGNRAVKVGWSRFENDMLKTGEVEKIVMVVNQGKANIFIKPEKLSQEKYKEYQNKGNSVNPYSGNGPHYFIYFDQAEDFKKMIETSQAELPEEQHAVFDYNREENYMKDILGWVLPIAIIVIIWMFIIRRMSGGAGAGGAANIFNVGKSKATLFDKESHVKLDFNDVAGLEEAKVEVMEIVDFLKNPKKYTELGGKIPKGALLIGPPGTGKTLLAKAVAGEANVPFFSMSGSDFVEMFVGVGASRVRDLFKQAKDKAPCIVFIDEIDAIGRARGKNPNMGANDERENTLNQLLTEMDGFGTNVGVIILAATNRADILDRALMRAGRFDRQISVELPDIKEREEIFKVHLRPVKVAKDLKVDFLAKQTPGFSGADIANVCNEAALIAARKEKKTVGRQDFLDAVDRIIGGLEKKNKIISLQEKKTIAYHEAGHATVSWLLEYANPLLKVTIIPRGRALGAAWYLPEERQLTNTDQLLDEMCSTLGGRASEEINFRKISTGALNDLERVTKQAYAMVTYYGMSKNIGNLSYYDSTGQNEYSFSKPYSDKTAESIDKEVKSIVEQQYQRAKKVLMENKEGLEKIAELLLEREVIFAEDLEKVFGKKKGRTYEEERQEAKEKLVKKRKQATVKGSKSTGGEEKKEKSATPEPASKDKSTGENGQEVAGNKKEQENKKT